MTPWTFRYMRSTLLIIAVLATVALYCDVMLARFTPVLNIATFAIEVVLCGCGLLAYPRSVMNGLRKAGMLDQKPEK